MSLRPVPICVNCSRSTEVSISCTTCWQICCATCFNVTPTDNCVAIKSEPEDQLSVAETARVVCPFHSRDCKLFCTNCNVTICGLCIDEGQPHELHHIDNFSIIYREKMSQMESKLLQAQKSVEALGERTAICQWNLELLEKEEAVVLREIDIVAESSKLKVTRQTSIRKERLQTQLRYPAEKLRVISHTLERVRTLPANDFMKNLSELDQLCSTLVTSTHPDNTPLEVVDDIECDLVPAYRFGRYTTTAFFQEGSTNHTFSLITSRGTAWTINLLRSDKVQVVLSPNDPELLKFPHKLIVIIPHMDSVKEIRETFELKQNNTAFDVAPVSKLVELGFNDDLVIRIGIRPLNVVIENQLLNYQYQQLQIKKTSVDTSLLGKELKLAAILNKPDYNHLVMHYTMHRKQLKKYWDNSSFHLIDGEGRSWCLHLSPENDIGAYVQLRRGPGTHCTYFIELKHEDPKQSIIMRSSVTYIETDAEEGWNCFIGWKQLVCDKGFFPDGILRFRFGVRPRENGLVKA
ncbi:uncharacterized protein LOC134216983 isoform X2 [Armigeres subalbatus]|uniref:uncharacterized protein LOC134216983 isoform X2 n=1 Tax=Armigeres subalbatus TaxID=124917 RepID=UPI002ED2FEE5